MDTDEDKAIREFRELSRILGIVFNHRADGWARIKKKERHELHEFTRIIVNEGRAIPGIQPPQPAKAVAD